MLLIKDLFLNNLNEHTATIILPSEFFVIKFIVNGLDNVKYYLKS
jgi:hypothetical protein